ncbi:MAG: alpha/beta fold hydrolase [Actinobacteria bacterium]|nr:alpha/beta fold hydrolase [Actinomycetota bacterium]
MPAIFGRSGYREIGGRRTFVIDVGQEHSARALVLVHGWGGDASAWAELIPGLQRHARVVAVDLRGHGAAPAGEEDVTLDVLAADLVALLATLANPERVLVGHSLGGALAAMVAVNRPDLVSGAVLIDPAYGAGDREMKEAPGRLAEIRREGGAVVARRIDEAFGQGAEPAVMLRAAYAMATTPPDVLASLYASNYLDAQAIGSEPGAIGWIRRRRVRTLVLVPSEERATLDRVHGSDTDVVVLQGAGHFLHHEQASAVLVTIERWLGVKSGG